MMCVIKLICECILTINSDKLCVWWILIIFFIYSISLTVYVPVSANWIQINNKNITNINALATTVMNNRPNYLATVCIIKLCGKLCLSECT